MRASENECNPLVLLHSFRREPVQRVQTSAVNYHRHRGGAADAAARLGGERLRAAEDRPEGSIERPGDTPPPAAVRVVMRCMGR